MERGKGQRKKVGVIGLGSVGKAVLHSLSFFFDCIGYDLVGDYAWEDVLEAGIVFLCVPTPEGTDGRLNCTEIDQILSRLTESRYKGLVAIKSTVRIGFMEQSERRYPFLRLLYMPEFLRERSSFTWFVHPDRIVISGGKSDIDEALSYFEWVESAEILRMDHRCAEIGKLAHNAYIATKVSFTNEIERICKEHGADPKRVMSVIWADRRVRSKEHLQPGIGPYDGKCVPKDTRELINSTDKSILLEAVEEVNKKTRAEYEGRDDSSA